MFIENSSILSKFTLNSEPFEWLLISKALKSDSFSIEKVETLVFTPLSSISLTILAPYGSSKFMILWLLLSKSLNLAL